ncbi:MAG: ABC transporter permease [Spirochaetales bacterium]|nr:ABC transporter permease [Spirochaetales bacterium]
MEKGAAAPALREKGWKTFLERNPGIVTPLGVAIPLVVIVVVISLSNPVFLSQRNVFNILRQTAVFMVLGVGMTFVIATGGIDLSVGSTVGLTACVAGLLLDPRFLGGPSSSAVAILAAVAVGALVGVVNGTAVSFFRVPPLIATLGMLNATRGVAYLIMGQSIARSFPQAYQNIGQAYVGPVPVPVVIALCTIAIGVVFLNMTKTGKYVLATGGNEEAARRFGVRVNRYKFLVYVVSGALAGVAGILLSARLSAAQATLGQVMELHTIAVVVIGGTYLFGGYATLLGTFLGAILLGVLENGLLIIGVPFYWQMISIGFLLVIAVAIQLYRFRSMGSS